MLRSIPPSKMNHNEVMDLIKIKIPSIDNEVQRSYVRDVSKHRLHDYNTGIRWRDWSEAIRSALTVTLDMPYSEQRKIDVLKNIYSEVIHPYASQFKTKGDAMAEAYMVCMQLCKEWSIPEEQIHYGLNFVDIWDKERSWDIAELQKS